MYSGQFCARTATRSPSPTPSARSPRAKRNARCANSPWLTVRPSKMIAGASLRNRRFRLMRSPSIPVTRAGASFELNPGFRHQRLPTRQLLPQEFRRLLRRIAERIDPERLELAAQLRVVEPTDHLAIEPVHDLHRRAAGSDE